MAKREVMGPKAGSTNRPTPHDAAGIFTEAELGAFVVRIRAERAAAGLPPRITDTETLNRVARLVFASMGGTPRIVIRASWLRAPSARAA
jgi:hypothetical protein